MQRVDEQRRVLVRLPVREMLDAVLAELLRTRDRADPVDEATVVAVEAAAKLVAITEWDDRDQQVLETIRETIGLMRAGVVAATYALWSMDDRSCTPAAGAAPE